VHRWRRRQLATGGLARAEEAAGGHETFGAKSLELLNYAFRVSEEIESTPRPGEVEAVVRLESVRNSESESTLAAEAGLGLGREAGGIHALRGEDLYPGGSAVGHIAKKGVVVARLWSPPLGTLENYDRGGSVQCRRTSHREPELLGE
jgi:hypothetical protein